MLPGGDISNEHVVIAVWSEFGLVCGFMRLNKGREAVR